MAKTKEVIAGRLNQPMRPNLTKATFPPRKPIMLAAVLLTLLIGNSFLSEATFSAVTSFAQTETGVQTLRVTNRGQPTFASMFRVFPSRDDISEFLTASLSHVRQDRLHEANALVALDGQSIGRGMMAASAFSCSDMETARGVYHSGKTLDDVAVRHAEDHYRLHRETTLSFQETGDPSYFYVIHFLGCAHLIRDDGRYANSPLRQWFNDLKSGRGPCCSDADGTALSDVDWESHGGLYRVRIDEVWIDVPEDAVLPGPNLAGRTMVWPMRYNGTITIRCFIPGSMI